MTEVSLSMKKQKAISGEYGSYEQSSSSRVNRPAGAETETPSKRATHHGRAEEDDTVKEIKQQQQRAVASPSSSSSSHEVKWHQLEEEEATDKESRRTSSGVSDTNSAAESISSYPLSWTPHHFKNVPVAQKHFKQLKQRGGECSREIYTQLEMRKEGEIVLMTGITASRYYKKLLACLARFLSVREKFIVHRPAKQQIVVTDVPTSPHEVAVRFLDVSFALSPLVNAGVDPLGSVTMYIGNINAKREPDGSYWHRNRRNRPNWPEPIKDQRTWCNIVVEVGLSESFPSLVEDAEVYLSHHTQIRAVLLVKIYAPVAETGAEAEAGPRPVPMLIALYQRPMPWPEHPDPNVLLPNPDWVISFGTGALSHQARPFVTEAIKPAPIIGVEEAVGCPVADGQNLAVECNQEHQLVCTIPAGVLYDGVPGEEEVPHPNSNWVINLFDLQQFVLRHI